MTNNNKVTEKVWKTKLGNNMRPHTRRRIVEIMTNPMFDGSSQPVLASIARVSSRTLQNYLTEELWDEIKCKRLEVIHFSLGEVDKVVLQKAINGDISAARLLYARWDKRREEIKRAERAEKLAQSGEIEGEDIPITLEELDEQIEMIQKEIDKLEEV